MVMVTVNQDERYYDGGLTRNLDALKEMVRKDWDGLLFIFGREGVGKSTFTLQLAAYLDPEFSIDKIAWTPEQFMEKVLNAKRHSCIVLDEAYLTFTNHSSIGHLQKVIASMLTMIRSRNLFLLIVSPTIFDMSKYLVVHRSLAAFRCYHRGMERGFWEMYDEDAKLRLYVKGRKDNDLRVAQAVMSGRFTRWMPVDKEEYNRRKDEAVNTLRERMMKPKKEMDDGSKEKDIETEVLVWLDDNNCLRHGALTKYSAHQGIDNSSLSRRMRQYRLQQSQRTSVVDSLAPHTILLKKTILEDEQA